MFSQLINNIIIYSKNHRTMSGLNNSLLGLVAITSAASTLQTSVASTAAETLRNQTVIRRTVSNMTNSTNTTDQDTTKKLDTTTKRVSDAAHIIKNANVVCFDVDSTVITEEGIDELAQFCGAGADVARLTREAMKGSMTFQDALRMRLNIINPSQRQIRDFLKAKPSTLTPGIKEFVTRLRNNNIKVYLVTGGFDCLIEPVANELGIPLENMYANTLFFKFNGDYAGFDVNQPTSRSGGKGEAIKLIRSDLADNANIVMIGDGATDLEAAPPADHFIGFGGNIVRDEVRSRAKYYVTAFEQMSTELL